MLRPTFGMVRQASYFWKPLGLCATNVGALADAVNEAQECLINDPLAPDDGWYGSTVSLAVNVQVVNGPNGYAYITTPQEIARLEFIDLCRRPIPIRNRFFEYLQFGIGLQPRPNSCGNGQIVNGGCGCGTITAAFERDNVYTLSDFPGTPQYVRIFPTDDADLGKLVLVHGNDQNDVPVTTTDPLTGVTVFGEYVAITSPFAQTINQFIGPLMGLNKEPTTGFVKFFAVDPSTGNQVPLSSMEPNETTSNYRRYLLNGLPAKCCDTALGTVTLTSQARLDFTPVNADSDYLMIQSIPALAQEAQAQRYAKMDTVAAAKLEAKHHQKAINLLNGQLDLKFGKTQTAIIVPLFGSDRLRLNPV